MQDAELIDILHRDPEEGMRAMVAQYGGLIYAVIRRRLSHGDFCSADIESCAADTFSEFYLDLDKYDGQKGSIRSWLCVIARNNACDLARRRSRTELLDLQTDEIAAPAHPENETEERELRRAVLEEVKGLGEPDREIILRKFYLGESSKQIAARLGLTVSGVDTRTNRAVQKLRARLEKWR